MGPFIVICVCIIKIEAIELNNECRHNVEQFLGISTNSDYYDITCEQTSSSQGPLDLKFTILFNVCNGAVMASQCDLSIPLNIDKVHGY